MQTLIADVEGDGFLHNMTRLWTIQIGTADGDDVTVYADQPGYPSLQEGADRLKSADRVVFHNGMKFDIHAVNRFFPGTLDPQQLFDSMVAARLIWPEMSTHTLEAWGDRLKIAKGSYGGDFSRFDDELVKYARQDIHVTRALFRRIQEKMQEWDWSFPLWLEQLFQYVIGLQEQNGFRLDVGLARELEGELRQELADIGTRLQEIFPPRWVPKDKTVEKSTRKNKRKGPDKKAPAYEQPYVAITLEIFNAGSRQQAANRLQERYPQWKPWKFTDGGAIALDEDVLGELPFPEAKELLRYLEVEKQLGQIINKSGDKGWLIYVNDATERVHGAVNPLGTGTRRCSHFKPNMGQVNKKNLRMRACWIPRDGWKLVGADADGLEFCCLAHYVHKLDGGKTTERHLKGDKKKGTDVHSANRDAILEALSAAKAGMKLEPTDDQLKKLRENAKTILYALMYGASDPKLGVTVIEMCKELGIKPPKPPKALGKMARKALGKGIPGLDKLIEDVKKKANKKKYLKTIDGGKITVRSEHSAFNFLLQSAGAIAMKLALVIFHFEHLEAKGWVHSKDYGYCANVHDEVQIEAKPEIADEIGKLFAQSIQEAGERLGFRCPLSGTHDVGDTWAETH